MPEENKGKTWQKWRWLVLVTVIFGTFLGRLDQTIVNLALPKIISDFKLTVATGGWIATAYILANAVFVPIWGKLGDTVGRKKVYLLGFAIFIAGSVLAALSWNFTSLIVFRVIQAVASSADYPTAMAILTITFPKGKQRAQALGLWSASFAAATVFGPLIGGPLIDNFGWRSIFMVNLPVGVIGMMMAFAFIHESKSQSDKKPIFDWGGAIILGLALTTLVLVLDRGLTWGWMSIYSWLCYIGVVVFGYWFYRLENRIAEPIVHLKFFKIGPFVTTLINSFLVFMGMMGSVFLLPIFAQTYLGYNATQTGYLFMPMAFFIMIASPLGGSLTGKIQPRYVVAISTFIAGIGLLLFSRLDPASTALSIIIPLSVMAFGIGFGMAQRTNIIASVVPESEIGVASSILALVRNIAGAFGIAVFATILDNSVNGNVLRINRFSAFHGTQSQLSQYIKLIILKAQVLAYDHVFVVASAFLFVGFVMAFWIKVDKERKAKIVLE